MVDRLLLRPEEAAQLVGIGRTQMFGLIRRGEVLSVKVGRSRRIPVAALREWAERLAVEAAGQGA